MEYDLKIKYEDLVKHHTQQIKDKNDNKWEVVETSDLEEICEAYHQNKLKSLGINVVDSEERTEFPHSSIPQFGSDEWIDACEQLFGGMRKSELLRDKKEPTTWDAFLAGYKKRAEMSGLKYDEVSELHAKTLYKCWISIVYNIG